MDDFFRHLSPVQQLNIRLAQAEASEQLAEILANVQDLQGDASGQDARALRQIEAIAEIRRGCRTRGMEIFREEIARRRGSSRDAFLSVAASYVPQAAAEPETHDTMLQILAYPAQPMVRAEFLYRLAKVLSEAQLRDSSWRDVVADFFEAAGQPIAEPDFEQFQSYADRFFSDRRRLNSAVAAGAEIAESELETEYWRRQLAAGYP